jgi:hypothetical protein
MASTSKIRAAAILVLVKELLSNTVDSALHGMVFIWSLTTISSGIQVILRLLSQQFQRLQYSYYKWEWFIICAIQMVLGWHCHTQIYMTVGSGSQVMLRVLSHSFRVYSAGITDGRNLWSTLLRLLHMTDTHTKFHEDQYRHS